jgi:hypothetical protein
MDGIAAMAIAGAQLDTCTKSKTTLIVILVKSKERIEMYYHSHAAENLKITRQEFNVYCVNYLSK